MKITANGVEVPVTNNTINIELVVDDNGEDAPQINITATGGRLDAYAGRVKRNGDIHVHVFGDEK